MSTAEYERLGDLQRQLDDVHTTLIGLQVLLSWTIMAGAVYYLYKSGALERLAAHV